MRLMRLMRSVAVQLLSAHGLWKESDMYLHRVGRAGRFGTKVQICLLHGEYEQPTFHGIQILKTVILLIAPAFFFHFGEPQFILRFAAGPCHYLLCNRSGSTGPGTVIGLGGAQGQHPG